MFSLRNTAIIFGLAAVSTSAYLISRADLTGWAGWLSALCVVLLSSPSIHALVRWLGKRDAVKVIAALILLAVIHGAAGVFIESLYGHPEQPGSLGSRSLIAADWEVASAWPALVAGAYAVAARYFDDRRLRVPAVTILSVAFAITFYGGANGVAASNFAGWLISGTVAGFILEVAISRLRPLLPAPVQLSSGAMLIFFYWTCVAAFSGMWVPTLIGAIVLTGLAAFWRLKYYSFDEMVVLVDSDGNHLGTASKYSIHQADTPLHKAFSVFLFNEDGELLLQQRAHSKKTWPGVWSNSCCGHQMLHETPDNAVRRRLNDELRITSAELHLILPDYRYRAEKDGVVENEICPVFVGFTDQSPRPNRREVADVQWIPWEDAVEIISTANGFSPWAVEELTLLSNDPQFRRLATARIPGYNELKKAA
jgi:isopentenyl-diphosphate delta-isomerase